MRVSREREGLRVQAIAGTHTVLLGMNLSDRTGCLGFSIHRADLTDGDAHWLRGMKTFASVAPDPPAGSTYSTFEHPVQGFQWGDYGAKPGHTYDYKISAMRGQPGALIPSAPVRLRVRTEVEDDGRHGVWFNRGVAGSQAFAHRFPDFVPGQPLDDRHPAMVWLSRGLGEAFVQFCAEALGVGWELRGAFYEFTWDGGLAALALARERGVDVRVVVHGRDRDTGSVDDDRTAAQAREAVERRGLTDAVIWRTAANKGALLHHKFLVLVHHGVPVAVWTGSTNLTRGGVYGHSNVGHLVRDRILAEQFVQEWARLADNETTADLRAVHEAGNPVAETVPASPDGHVVLSPRSTDSTVLSWYAALFDSAHQSAHITGAFGLNKVFRDTLEQSKEVMRTVLLEKQPPRDQAIPHSDPHVRISTGSHLANSPLEQWADEFLTGFNTHVKYIHTKIILIDPMTRDPTILTGSANYSTASTVTNEEHTLVLRTGRRHVTSRRAMGRVADIYLTEYHRLFMHFVFRAMNQDIELNSGVPQATRSLREDDGWSRQYYVEGSWRALQRRLFSGA